MGFPFCRRDHGNAVSLRSRSIEASTKRAHAGILRRGKSNSGGQNTSSGSKTRGQVSTEKSILLTGNRQSRASCLSSPEMSHALFRNLRRRKSFFQVYAIFRREPSESAGIMLVRNGGTEESSTEITVLEN